MSAHVPEEGELSADIVRASLGLKPHTSLSLGSFDVPNRPPQLCQGCPHGNAYDAIRKAVGNNDDAIVASDIGCYTLGALPPYSAIETCVCMGASIGIAKGAAEAGFHPSLAVIGDSTFLHSGVTPLMDVVSANADVTVIILDNDSIAMTGNQPTVLPSSRIEQIVKGIGVAPDHLHVLDAHPKKTDEHAAVIRREMEYHGPSVIIIARECLEKARKRKQSERKGK